MKDLEFIEIPGEAACAKLAIIRSGRFRAKSEMKNDGQNLIF
jgi:hypothetical protein